MDSYFNIKAIPDPEMLQSAVVGQLMQAMHFLLPSYAGRVGLGFPGYGQSRTLGGILRVHGSAEDVQKLENEVKDNSIFRSYALVTSVEKIPNRVNGYAEYRRFHVKGESHYRRLEKRHKARGTWTPELEKAIAEKYQEPMKCPHVALKSRSTGQPKFMLFVKKLERGEAIGGVFNSYGLSVDGATVPLF
jgi:CRISPR-associated endonuclease Csy4